MATFSVALSNRLTRLRSGSFKAPGAIAASIEAWARPPRGSR
jgi:hypothetical protein